MYATDISLNVVSFTFKAFFQTLYTLTIPFRWVCNFYVPYSLPAMQYY